MDSVLVQRLNVLCPVEREIGSVQWGVISFQMGG
jgi:hypothetical protein